MLRESLLGPWPTCSRPSMLELPRLRLRSAGFRWVKLYLCSDSSPLSGRPVPTGAAEGHGNWVPACRRGWQRAIHPEGQIGHSPVLKRQSYSPARRFFSPLSQAECTLNQLDFFHKVKDAVSRSHSAGSKSLFLFSLEL